MKAEHRKELQTNVLADRMGRLVQRIKKPPKKGMLFWMVLGLVVLGVVFFFIRSRQTAAQERSRLWATFEDGLPKYINELKDSHGDTNSGKAAQFEYAWYALWDVGIKILGKPELADQALHNIQKVSGNLYKRLSKECAGDPVWEPEALYGLAIVEETRAIRTKGRAEHLKNALEQFQKLAKNHKDSAFGKLAQKRAELLDKKGEEIARFYEDLQDRLRVPEEGPELKLPKGE